MVNRCSSSNYLNTVAYLHNIVCTYASNDSSDSVFKMRKLGLGTSWPCEPNELYPLEEDPLEEVLAEDALNLAAEAPSNAAWIEANPCCMN